LPSYEDRSEKRREDEGEEINEQMKEIKSKDKEDKPMDTLLNFGRGSRNGRHQC
jgi:hypothetical protein